MSEPTKPNAKHESLSDTVSHLLEECRMVLPGIQALFGFQLIAVFNQVFWEKVQQREQVVHLIAIGLVAVSVALVMAPAAYHRQAEPETISKRFITLSTRLLSLSMLPLMLGISFDFYIIGRLILRSWMGSLLLTLMLLSIFVVLWFLLPRIAALQRIVGGSP
jgi:hypothetical protein